MLLELMVGNNETCCGERERDRHDGFQSRPKKRESRAKPITPDSSRMFALDIPCHTSTNHYRQQTSKPRNLSAKRVNRAFYQTV